MHRLVQAQVDLAALTHNLAVARRAAGTRQVWPVVKADAYGHGMEQVVAALATADGFCVADLDEGLRLRQAGVQQPVLVIQGACSLDGLQAAATAGLVLGLHDPVQLELLERYQDSLPPGSLRIWLKVDTGMRRLGLAPATVASCRARLERLQAVAEVGLMTHLACADEPDHPLNGQQLQALEAVAGQVSGPVSGCNSAALLAGLLTDDQVVRPGIMLYGASPLLDRDAAALGLRPAMRLVSRLLAVKPVAAGESVGYGATWQAPQAGRIGLVAIGYGDGYPRAAGSQVGRAPVEVLVRGRLVPLCGRVSMDSLAVDLSSLPEARAGDPVVLWGDRPSVDAVARRLGTIGYDLLAGLTARVPRHYRSD